MPSLSQIQYDLPGHLTKFAGPQVDKDAKVAAARGMLPLPPADLVHVLFALTLESDPGISEAAGKSLAQMPENILKTIIESPETNPLILDFMARNLPSDSAMIEAVALNRSTHDETFIFMSELTNKQVVDIISQNQIRILRCPDIVDALAENILTGRAQLDRIIKFVQMETERAQKKAPAGEGMEVEIEHVEEKEEEVAAVTQGGEDEVAAVTVDEESPWAKMTFDDDLLKDHKLENKEEEEEVEKNLFKRIQTMKVSQKIKLALTGGSEARKLLIKDANKLVSSSVLKSPRITDGEIDTISKSKSLSEEVIRKIANSKEWTKSYSVKMNLVTNPKTSLPDAMRFMNFLRDKDIRDISRSKNVPTQIAAQAKRIMRRKEDKAKPRVGGH